MSDHVYKTLELTGTSQKGIEDAVQRAIKKASETVNNMRWFQIVDERGAIEGDHITKWQVTIKVGFTIE